MVFYQSMIQQRTLSTTALQWIERLGLLMLLAMPLLMFLGIALCDIAIVSIAALFVIRSIVLRDFTWLNQSWLKIGLVLWVYLIMISGYAIVDPSLSFKQALPFGRYLIFAAALQCWLLRDPANQRCLLYAMTATALFIAADVICTFLTGFSLFGKSSVQYRHFEHVTWIWQRQFTRIVGLNGKMNYGILLAWSVIPVLVFLLMTLRQYKIQWRGLILGMASVLVCLAVLMTGERMALLELSLGLFLILCLIKPLRLMMLCIGIVFAVTATWILLHSPALWYRNVSQIHHAVLGFWDNDYGRIMRTSWAIFCDHPIFGVGLKQYFFLSTSPAYSSFNAVNSHVQNVYLEFMTGTGLIGTVLFLALLWCWLKQFWQQRARIRVNPILIGVFIAFLLRIWPFASTTSFFFAWGAITFWWMGAWLLASTEENSNA